MQLTLERKIATGFVVALLVLLLIGVASWWSLIRFERAFGSVAHTHLVLNTLEQTLVQALNVQTGSRGYALSGDRRFLEPFNTGIAAIDENLAAARQLTANDALMQEWLDELDTQVERLLRQTFRRNELVRQGAADTVLTLEALLEGKRTLDEIRTLINQMENHERDLLEMRTRLLGRRAALARSVLLLSIAAVLAFSAYAGTRVQREFAARQRADLALQRSRALFETLFEQATDALLVSSPNGTIRRVNRRAEALFGYDRAELVGRSLEDLMPERYRVRHVAHRASFNAAPTFRSMGAGLELFGLRKGGTEFPADIILSPLELEDGRAVLGAVRDVTERKAAAQALQRSADEIRDLYNLAPCGYHSLDENGVFVSVNDTELEWLGLTREQVVGKLRFGDVLTESSRDRFERNYAEFKATGRVASIELEMCRCDGSTFFVSLSSTATYDAQHRYLRSRATVHDITERREAERRLALLHAELQQHSTDLEAANRELEAFSYSVSHDLRAPLRHMAGFATMLEEHLEGHLDGMARRYLTTIKGAARKMGLLIDDLLAFSRLGRAPIQRTNVATDEIVRGLVAENFPEAHQTTQWHIAPLPNVQGDRGLLSQVWQNLLGNAAKYSRRSQPPAIHVRAEETADEIIFSVQDNGVGFDSRYADKLFQVFSRLHSDAEFPGTGIGLALVHRIVTRHGGRVWAESQPGAGATFYFALPRHSDDNHSSASPDPAR
jgi:PAS domain S-box-containing protein